MNLYLLQQSVNTGWDTYDSMIICATDPEEAIELSYKQFGSHCKDRHYVWVMYSCKDQIEVKLIGTATEELEKGVMLSSFNAG